LGKKKIKEFKVDDGRIHAWGQASMIESDEGGGKGL
jgi:hypothetical protein